MEDETHTAQTETEAGGVAATAPGRTEEPPPGGYRSIGRFVILDRLGAGGMGVVLSAYDPQLDRKIALKLLHDRRGQARLQREAQAMARLAHPNVVTIYDVGVVDDQLYVAMELVDGETLRAWRRRQDRSWREVVEIFAAAGRGLAAAHAAGLVHRDFKPDNVLVGNDGRVRVADFGLASTSSRTLESSSPELRSGLDSADLVHGLTAQGAVLGTPAYMSPEQHDGSEVDPRADQFAFCAALYEALYDERPFRARAYKELAAEAKAGVVRDPPAGSKVPAWLRAVALRGLRPRREDRFPDMEALLRALRRDPAVARRRILGAVTVVVLAGLAIWGQCVRRGNAAELCTGARAQLTGIWDPVARERVRVALLATGKPYADATGSHVTATLDRYADGWVAMRTNACRATRVRGEQSEALMDLRMACLDRRRSQLGALVEVLATAGGDVKVLDRAARAALDLEPVERCAETIALTEAVPPPRDPATAARVHLLEGRLDRLSALRAVGTYKPTLDEVSALVVDADATGYGPLRAAAYFLLGDLHFATADVPGSERDLLTAVRVAGEARLDGLLARSLVTYAEVEIGRAGQYQQGLALARVAEAVGLRAGDELVTAAARLSQGWALLNLSRNDEAESSIRAALATYQRRAKDAPGKLVLALTRAGIVAYERGHYAEALDYDQRALATAIAVFGPDHPGLWDQYIELSNVASAQGQPDTAVGFGEKALAIIERSKGPDSADAAIPLNNLAYEETALGDLDRAEVLYTRALAIRDKTVGSAHPDYATTLANLGDVRRRQGRTAEARAMIERAVPIHLATAGADSGVVAIDHSYLGYLAQQERHLAEAREHLQRASAIRAKTKGTDTPDYATGLIDEAALEVDDGRCPPALTLLERAQPILDKGLPADHYQRAAALTIRGRCALAAGKGADAVPLLERAVTLLEKARLRPRQIGASRAWLARALWTGDPERSRREAAQADAELVAGGAETAFALGELRAWRRAHP